MLSILFFQIVSVNELTEKIQRAILFIYWTVALSDCVKYKKNIRIHDIQREVLVKVDSKFFKMRYFWWERLTLLKTMTTWLSREWDLPVITMQISSSAHICLSSALLMKWQVTETKNVVLFILRDFADYHFIITLSCCSFYQWKWKSNWKIVLTSSPSTRRSKHYERSSEKLQ